VPADGPDSLKANAVANRQDLGGGGPESSTSSPSPTPARSCQLRTRLSCRGLRRTRSRSRSPPSRGHARERRHGPVRERDVRAERTRPRSWRGQRPGPLLPRRVGPDGEQGADEAPRTFSVPVASGPSPRRRSRRRRWTHRARRSSPCRPRRSGRRTRSEMIVERRLLCKECSSIKRLMRNIPTFVKKCRFGLRHGLRLVGQGPRGKLSPPAATRTDRLRRIVSHGIEFIQCRPPERAPLTGCVARPGWCARRPRPRADRLRRWRWRRRWWRWCYEHATPGHVSRRRRSLGPRRSRSLLTDRVRRTPAVRSRATSWTFGDGGTGSGVTVQHTYQAAGTYTATLVVTDNLGAASAPFFADHRGPGAGGPGGDRAG